MDLLNQSNIEEEIKEEGDSNKYRSHIRRMWEYGLDEAASPYSCNQVPVKSKKRAIQKARPAPNPLGMNQDDSDPDIESPRTKSP